MPTYEFTAPDGKSYEVGAPDGATQEQAFAMLQSQIAGGTAPAPTAPSAAVSAGRALNGIPRQIGLTARYGLEGLANTAQVVTEPLRYFTDKLLPDRGGVSNLVTGQAAPPKSTPLGVQATKLADMIGLPSPETPTERVVGDATRLVAGAAGMAGASQAGAQAVATPVSNFVASLAAAPTRVGVQNAASGGATWGQNLLRSLSANVPAQLTSAAGAGLAGGASREAGGGPWQQAGAALIGTVAGGVASSAADRVLAAGRRALMPNLSPQDIDVKLTALLGQSGTDFAQLPEAVRASLRTELATALSTGQNLDPAAVSRLAAFRTVGATPTRGMLSQNPVDITREQNLAKMAANSADGELHGLPLVQNQNNTALIGRLNDSGAARGDAFVAGEQAVGAIGARDAAEAARVTGLYNSARAMPGGNIPLERTGVVNGIYDALARENKLAFLPENVSNMLNTISRGSVKVGDQVHNVPFDANALDNLMTTIATAQRGTADGNVKAALRIARQAIDDAAVTPIKAPVAGSPLVTQAGADYLRAQDAQAPAFMQALNEARAAARGRFGWQESSRPVEAALGGVQPDSFVKRFVLGGTLDDAEAVAREAPMAPMKDAIVAHLKERALAGAADEVGKFSQSAYNKALNAIGDRKLGVFFSPEEIGQLRAVGRVASLIQSQPVGSAVNNSNSGALLLGRGMDAVNALAGKVPFGRAAVVDPLRSINLTISQRRALDAAPGLLRAAPQAADPGASFLLPGLAVGGGLLAAQ